MDIKNKNVLITGGSLRIGRELCLAFAGAGANVIIHCNKSEEAARKLADELGGGGKHRIVRCNLACPEEVAALLDSAGSVDVLINNASMFKPELSTAESAELLRTHFEVNFFAPLTLMKKFQAQLNGKPGCIINFLDQDVAKVSKRSGGYSLSRKALRDATLSAALQMAPQVRVNAIAPGPVLPPVGMEDSKMEQTLKEVPLLRPVDLRDLTLACIFLAENESITGEILFVDCGQHLK
jgi:NAD(P)-dependent dehydrogenase (short-subunit alcohol dehydrogenase family)